MPLGSAEISLDHSFGASLERVVAMYANPDFARERGLSMGASECDVLVDGDAPGAFTVVIRRTLPTEGFQPEFRPFIGPTITVRYSEAWGLPDEGGREATFAVDILGVPARAAGTLRLTPRGDETDLSLQGSITTHVPLLAGLVTRAILDSLNDAVAKEFATADAWLARS